MSLALYLPRVRSSDVLDARYPQLEPIQVGCDRLYRLSEKSQTRAPRRARPPNGPEVAAATSTETTVSVAGRLTKNVIVTNIVLSDHTSMNHLTTDMNAPAPWLE